jgi:hypothetical protein
MISNISTAILLAAIAYTITIGAKIVTDDSISVSGSVCTMSEPGTGTTLPPPPPPPQP